MDGIILSSDTLFCLWVISLVVILFTTLELLKLYNFQILDLLFCGLLESDDEDEEQSNNTSISTNNGETRGFAGNISSGNVVGYGSINHDGSSATSNETNEKDNIIPSGQQLRRNFLSIILLSLFIRNANITCQLFAILNGYVENKYDFVRGFSKFCYDTFRNYILPLFYKSHRSDIHSEGGDDMRLFILDHRNSSHEDNVNSENNTFVNTNILHTTMISFSYTYFFETITLTMITMTQVLAAFIFLYALYYYTQYLCELYQYLSTAKIMNNYQRRIVTIIVTIIFIVIPIVISTFIDIEDEMIMMILSAISCIISLVVGLTLIIISYGRLSPLMIPSKNQYIAYFQSDNDQGNGSTLVGGSSSITGSSASSYLLNSPEHPNISSMRRKVRTANRFHFLVFLVIISSVMIFFVNLDSFLVNRHLYYTSTIEGNDAVHSVNDSIDGENLPEEQRELLSDHYFSFHRRLIKYNESIHVLMEILLSTFLVLTLFDKIQMIEDNFAWCAFRCTLSRFFHNHRNYHGNINDSNGTSLIRNSSNNSFSNNSNNLYSRRQLTSTITNSGGSTAAAATTTASSGSSMFLFPSVPSRTIATTTSKKLETSNGEKINSSSSSNLNNNATTNYHFYQSILTTPSKENILVDEPHGIYPHSEKQQQQQYPAENGENENTSKLLSSNRGKLPSNITPVNISTITTLNTAV